MKNIDDLAERFMERMVRLLEETRGEKDKHLICRKTLAHPRDAPGTRAGDLALAR